VAKGVERAGDTIQPDWYALLDWYAERNSGFVPEETNSGSGINFGRDLHGLPGVSESDLKGDAFVIVFVMVLFGEGELFHGLQT